MNEIGKLLQEVLDKQREASYLLWQTLLTINGFIATIVIGLSAFGSINSSPFWVKAFIELILICIIISSGLIARIFYLVSGSYANMAQLIKSVQEGHKKIDEIAEHESVGNATKIHSQIVFAEKSTLVLQVIIAGIIFLLVYYFLFLSTNSSNINSSPVKRHHNYLRGNI